MAAITNNLDSNFVKYDDTTAMLAPYINTAGNGLTKDGQTLSLGGTLTDTVVIATSAANFLAITGLQSGSGSTDSLMVVNPTTGQVKYISASSLFNSLTFSNGLTKTGDTVQLGGNLTKNTTIGTNGKNLTIGVGGAAGDSLNITGLPSGNLSTDSIVVVNGGTGKVAKVSAASLLQSGEATFTAAGGTTETYAVTNIPADVTRVWVYRNGVKLVTTTDYTVTGSSVKVEIGGSGGGNVPLIAGDVIEVQWVK